MCRKNAKPVYVLISKIEENMLITEKIQVEKEIVKDCICNMCGNTCIISKHETRADINCLVGEIMGQFFSTHIEDMVQYQFHLCESCTKTLMESFKIPPTKNDRSIHNIDFTENTLDEDIQE